jgi:hypothetical protein
MPALIDVDKQVCRVLCTHCSSVFTVLPLSPERSIMRPSRLFHAYSTASIQLPTIQLPLYCLFHCLFHRMLHCMFHCLFHCLFHYLFHCLFHCLLVIHCSLSIPLSIRLLCLSFSLSVSFSLSLSCSLSCSPRERDSLS